LCFGCSSNDRDDVLTQIVRPRAVACVVIMLGHRQISTSVPRVDWVSASLLTRDVQEWLFTFPFPPVPIYSIPIPSRSHPQLFDPFPFPWDSHWESHSHAHLYS